MRAALSSRLARHALFWGSLWGFFLLIQLPDHFITGQKLYWREYALVQMPTAILATYPLLYGLLPRMLSAGRRLPLFLGLLVVWLALSALMANLIQAFYLFVVAPALFQELPPGPYQWSVIFEKLSFNFFALLVIAGGASAIKVLNGWHDQQRLSQQLRQRRLHTELQLLKAQLQPTFLFQTLRTLHGLTLQKLPESPAAVLHLAALLHYMLYESPQDAVPLADEVEMMRHYVALEKLRLGRHVEVSLNFSGTLEAHTIAPLLLLPFVENAFRHGTGSPLEATWVSLDLVAKRDSLIFKVINSQAATEGSWAEKVGLRTLRQRLAHLYPDCHELKIVSEPDTFLTALYLQIAPQPLVRPRPQPAPALVSA